MEGMTDDVKRLLLKHDYITVVKKSGDGCIITYPHPKLLDNRPRLVSAFTFQRGDNPGLIGFDSYTKNQEERFVSIPEYAIRLFVICEIVACNLRIPIDPNTMVYLGEDNAEHNDIESIIDEPTNSDDIGKEGFLYRLIIESRNDNFPEQYDKVAETHGVFEGYNIIKKFYE